MHGGLGERRDDFCADGEGDGLIAVCSSRGSGSSGGRLLRSSCFFVVGSLFLTEFDRRRLFLTDRTRSITGAIAREEGVEVEIKKIIVVVRVIARHR